MSNSIVRDDPSVKVIVGVDTHKHEHVAVAINYLGARLATVEWAATLDLEVPQPWIFEDEGYSGATLERPGLEQVRDLAAAGDIQVVLVHSPDRLSRKYAYQVLLTEEFGRHGVETRFLNGPSNATAEDQSAGAVSGHDRRVRTRPDSRTVTSWQAAPRASR